MRWMEIAWEEQHAGVVEVAGAANNRRILEYSADIGRPDIKSDSAVPWCMAFLLWCLMRAGISIDVIPLAKRLLASSARMIGTIIPEPRVGAICLMPREGGNHVGFVDAYTTTTVDVLGGNQANSVCKRTFKRTSKMIFIWPEPAKTPAEMAETSRIAAAAKQQQKDGGKVLGTNGIEGLIPDPPATLPGFDTLVSNAGAFKGVVSGMESFVLFGWGKVWWIVAALSVYWVLRMAWNSGWIQRWRTEDHNTGKTVAVAPAEPVLEGEILEPDEEVSLA